MVPVPMAHGFLTYVGWDMIERIEDLSKADQTTRRALAIVLMREVLPLLDMLGENIAAGHRQLAIDTVMRDGESVHTEGSC